MVSFRGQVLEVLASEWKSGRFPVAGFGGFDERVEKWSVSGWQVLEVLVSEWKSGWFPVAGFGGFGERVEKWSVSGWRVWRFWRFRAPIWNPGKCKKTPVWRFWGPWAEKWDNFAGK